MGFTVSAIPGEVESLSREPSKPSLAVSLALPPFLGGLEDEAAVGTYGLAMAAVALGALLPLAVLSVRHAHSLDPDHAAGDAR